MRAKNTKVLWAASATEVGMDASFQKRNERELELYRQTRKQGIQPDNTSTPAIQRALDESDRTGVPYVSKI
jgi:hypothetical protein